MSAAALALDQRFALPAYERPTISLGSRLAERNEFCWPCVLFIVFCVTFVIALAWAAYCSAIGGQPYINWQWFPPGFTVTCLKYG
jgi:hypothetical protein